MIRIIVDSASDYQQEECIQNHMDLVSISVSIDGQTYQDGINMNRDHFYQTLIDTKEFPKTSQPSPQAFLEIFRDAREKGDDCICILLSSELSGTFQSAFLAKSMADYDNIYLVDSRTAACGIRILAELALKLRDMQYTAEDICQELETLKNRIRIVAVVDTLEYLYRGGRLSKTAATVGELANLKPILSVEKGAGTVNVIGKSLGKNKALQNLLKQLSPDSIHPGHPVYTLYSYGTDNCRRFEEKLKEAGISIDARLQIGPSIGSHVGPEVFGITYVTVE